MKLFWVTASEGWQGIEELPRQEVYSYASSSMSHTILLTRDFRHGMRDHARYAMDKKDSQSIPLEFLL